MNQILKQIRIRICAFCEKESPFKTGEIEMAGEIEMDESYFGARRIRGKRGRGAKVKLLFSV